MAHRLLGALSPSAFLRRHWQRRPLLVRDAIPRCGDWLQKEMLFELATRDDVQSRTVTRIRGRWHVAHGPFSLKTLHRHPARGWTLLVQGVEQFVPDAARLLGDFSFVPHARLDDLMVSYAVAGGGVGPHFDSYDVFLLQGTGTRRWQLSAQKDLRQVENAPLRILKHFRPEREWTLGQGDLLYLPPRYAHHGVAVDTCMTLSVGFRAPHKRELAAGFLDFLQDHLHMDGMIEDPGMPLQRHPGELPAYLMREIARTLKSVRWTRDDILRFAGSYLTEPKPQVVFQPPRRALPMEKFLARVSTQGVRLALPTRMLFAGKHVFINGECHDITNTSRHTLIRLADTRAIPPCAASTAIAKLLYPWYRAGYLHV